MPLILLICGVSTLSLSENNASRGSAASAAPSLVISAGLNLKSGIIDNQDVDAVSGATKIGFKAGAKTEIHIADNFHFFETGLEYSFIPQEIKYNDAAGGYDGKREFGLNLIRLPLTYNLHLLKNNNGNPLFVTRFGVSMSYLLFDNIKDTGSVPSYSMNKWETGPMLGFVYYPYENAGIFLDLYRGSVQLYKDQYHKKSGEGNLSGISFGMQYRFSNIFSR